MKDKSKFGKVLDFSGDEFVSEVSICLIVNLTRHGSDFLKVNDAIDRYYQGKNTATYDIKAGYHFNSATLRDPLLKRIRGTYTKMVYLAVCHVK